MALCGKVFTLHKQRDCNVWVCGRHTKVWTFMWKLLSSTFLRYCLFCCTRWNPMVWPFKWKLVSSTLLCCSLFLLYKVVITLSLWMKSYGVTIHVEATEHRVCSYGYCLYALQDGSTFRASRCSPRDWPFNWNWGGEHQVWHPFLY